MSMIIAIDGPAASGKGTIGSDRRARARSVISLFQHGGPSQMDLFDPKPELQKWSGKPLPPSMTKDSRCISPTLPPSLGASTVFGSGVKSLMPSDLIEMTLRLA